MAPHEYGPTSISPALVAVFAPTGTLRASINVGNPILANTDVSSGEPVGVSIDLAREFARRSALRSTSRCSRGPQTPSMQ